MHKLFCALAGVSAVALPAVALHAAATAPGPLQVVSKILVEQRVRAADGSVSVRMTPARKAVPGDHVQFVLSYRNTGTQPIANVVLDNPVPHEIAYRGPAGGSPAPEVSADGKTYAPLADLRVTSLGGVRAATPADVTHVRWRLAAPVAAGAQGQVSFLAMLN
jgi:uncharacterized repeat protein (TIGR01451 family)